MTPAEAARTLDQARAQPGARPYLRLVGSLEASEADGPGARLQALRQAQNLSVHQVAAGLRLRADQVAAIESMQFHRLPGLGYALGYVRAYGELLDIADCDGLVADFRDAWEPVQKRREAEKSTLLESRFALPAGLALALALVAWLVVWAAVHSAGGRGGADEIAPPDASMRAWAQMPVDAAMRPAADIAALGQLTATQDVRVTLRGEDGALVADRVLRAGEHMSTDGLGRWFVTASAGGVLVASGHGQSAVVGERGQPVSNWRVPDFAAVAAAEAEAARAAASASAGNSVNTDTAAATAAPAVPAPAVPAPVVPAPAVQPAP